MIDALAGAGLTPSGFPLYDSMQAMLIELGAALDRADTLEERRPTFHAGARL